MEENVRKIHCDRCTRVEEKPVPSPMVGLNPAAAGGLPTVNQQPLMQTMVLGGLPMPAFEATLLVDDSNGESKKHKAVQFKFQDLCEPCQRTVQALLYQIGKKIDGLSPDRKERGAKKGAAPLERAAPSTTSSPRHSAANAGSSSKGLATGTRSS
jgi:hypothetical protein